MHLMCHVLAVSKRDVDLVGAVLICAGVGMVIGGVVYGLIVQLVKRQEGHVSQRMQGVAVVSGLVPFIVALAMVPMFLGPDFGTHEDYAIQKHDPVTRQLSPGDMERIMAYDPHRNLRPATSAREQIDRNWRDAERKRKAKEYTADYREKYKALDAQLQREHEERMREQPSPKQRGASPTVKREEQSQLRAEQEYLALQRAKAEQRKQKAAQKRLEREKARLRSLGLPENLNELSIDELQRLDEEYRQKRDQASAALREATRQFHEGKIDAEARSAVSRAWSSAVHAHHYLQNYLRKKEQAQP